MLNTGNTRIIVFKSRSFLNTVNYLKYIHGIRKYSSNGVSNTTFWLQTSTELLNILILDIFNTLVYFKHKDGTMLNILILVILKTVLSLKTSTELANTDKLS